MMIIKSLILFIQFLLASNSYSNYTYYPGNYTFNEAIEKCASINCTVVFIGSETKNDYIYKNYVSNTNRIWLAIIDIFVNETNVNYYTNETLNYTDWGDFQNTGTPCITYSNAAYGPWDDVLCSDVASILCEINSRINPMSTSFESTSSKVSTGSTLTSTMPTTIITTTNSIIVSSTISNSSINVSTGQISVLSSAYLTSSLTVTIKIPISILRTTTDENLIHENTDFSRWFTVNCSFTRTRYNTLNSSEIEILNTNITNLDLCDKLDGNYSTSQIINIKNKSVIEVETIQNTLKIKLKEIEIHQIEVNNIKISVLWIAIVIIVFFCLFIIACDLHKLFVYFVNINKA
jgi:hypothetical protein